MELITRIGMQRNLAYQGSVYQGSATKAGGGPSRKKPPVGPESGRVAAQTTLAAPAATGLPPGSVTSS